MVTSKLFLTKYQQSIIKFCQPVFEFGINKKDAETILESLQSSAKKYKLTMDKSVTIPRRLLEDFIASPYAIFIDFYQSFGKTKSKVISLSRMKKTIFPIVEDQHQTFRKI